MISVIRAPQPNILYKNADTWANEYLKAIKKYKKNPTPTNKSLKEQLERRYNCKSVKEALARMFNDKCAYCESHVFHVSFPHIEHYKPKSKYPKLCFEWTNLFLACSMCNSSGYKGNKFPTKSKGGPYIDPEIEDPNDHFNFIFDQKTGVSIVQPKTRRGTTTERDLGLNRVNLLKHRNSVVKKLAFIALKAKNGDLDALVEIKSGTKPDEEYSAFALAFCKKFNL